MAVYKDNDTNTWRVIYRYTDWTGERKQSSKRGCASKKEAQAWEREQLQKTKSDLDMTFAAFVELYRNDMKTRLRQSTWQSKENIIHKKLIPYFDGKAMSEISAKDIIQWQNEMMNLQRGHYHRAENSKKQSGHQNAGFSLSRRFKNTLNPCTVVVPATECFTSQKAICITR